MGAGRGGERRLLSVAMGETNEDTIVFPIDLQITETIQVGDRRWFRRPEFHVTTFTPDDLSEATGVPEETLARTGQDFREELSRTKEIILNGRVSYAARDDGRQSIVAFCSVPGLTETYKKISAAVGAEVPAPVTHVTLYTLEPRMKGIGLTTAEQVDEYTSPLTSDDAAMVLAGVEILHGATSPERDS